MRTTLHRYPHPLMNFKILPQVLFPGSDLTGFHHFSILIQQAVMAPPIADIDAHCLARLSSFCGWLFDTLLHGWSPFASRMRADSIIACSARPAVSFHLKPI